MLEDTNSLDGAHIIVNTPNSAALILNNDLSYIPSGAADWLIDFNTSKTLSMLMSRKRNPGHHPPLYMNDTMMLDTTSHKHLGLTFSNSCNWNEHINKIATTAWGRLNLLRILKEPRALSKPFGLPILLENQNVATR